MSFDRQKFVDDLRALVQKGVKFRDQGKDPETGLDCVHVPRWAYREQGLELPTELDQELNDYPSEPDGWKMLATLRKWFEEIDPSQAEPGDLLVIYSRKNPCHVAIKVSDNLNVEAYKAYGKEGRLVERSLDPRRRIAAAFRIPETI